MRPVIRLFGPPVDEVVRFAAERFGRKKVIVWGIPPEVHVKCDTPEVIEAFLQRFTTSVFSITDGSLEATVAGLLIAAGQTLGTAESCTGGLIGHLLTGLPGVSACYCGGVVAYSNAAKSSVLGVPVEDLERQGAVSREVVVAMAEGIRRVMHSDWGLSVSGIAGPDGGTSEKPVGMVWMAAAGPSGTRAEVQRFVGDRAGIKALAAAHSLNLLRTAILGGHGGG